MLILWNPYFHLHLFCSLILDHVKIHSILRSLICHHLFPFLFLFLPNHPLPPSSFSPASISHPFFLPIKLVTPPTPKVVNIPKSPTHDEIVSSILDSSNRSNANDNQCVLDICLAMYKASTTPPPTHSTSQFPLDSPHVKTSLP